MRQQKRLINTLAEAEKREKQVVEGRTGEGETPTQKLTQNQRLLAKKKATKEQKDQEEVRATMSQKEVVKNIAELNENLNKLKKVVETRGENPGTSSSRRKSPHRERSAS